MKTIVLLFIIILLDSTGYNDKTSCNSDKIIYYTNIISGFIENKFLSEENKDFTIAHPSSFDKNTWMSSRFVNRKLISNINYVNRDISNDRYFYLSAYLITILLLVIFSAFFLIRNRRRKSGKESDINDLMVNAMNNYLPSGLALFDKNGILLNINNHLRDLLGINNADDLIFKFNFINDIELSEDLRSDMAYGNNISFIRTVNQFPSSVIEYINLDKIKDKFFDIKFSGIFNSGKELCGYVMFINDISNERKIKSKIDDLQSNLQLALEAGDMSSWYFDVETKEFVLIHGKMLNGGKMTLDEYRTFVYPEDAESLLSEFEKIISGEKQQSIAYYRLNYGSGWRWYMCYIKGQKFNGKITRIIGTRKDMSEEVYSKILLEEANKKLIESNTEILSSEERLKNILDKIPVPIFINGDIDEDDFYINEEALKVFGGQISCKQLNYLSEDDMNFQLEVNKKVFETGEEYRANEIVKLRDGRVMNTIVKKVLLNHQGKKHILVVRIDTTDRQKAKIASKILSASLPSLKTYLWYIDTRDNILNYNNIYITSERNLSEINSIEKFISIIHEEYRSYYRESINKLMSKETGEISVFYKIDLEEIGKYEWWESRIVVETVYKGDKSYKYLYGMSINVDKQKRNEIKLEQSKQKVDYLYKENELILNNITSVLIYLDPNYEVQWTNGVNIVGESFGKIYKKGEKCYKMRGFDKPCKECHVREAMLKHKVIKYEFVEIDNEIYEISSIPVENEYGFEGIIVKLDNVTERKKLIDDLRFAKEKTEESDRLKMAFLANMSHEIRTPLNAIVGFSEMMQFTDDPKDKKDYMKIINTNSDLLLRLINDILDLSKIESGIIEIKNVCFDVVEAFNDIYSLFNSRCEAKGLNLVAITNLERCIVSLDKNRFIQVVSNFISNAIKYTEKGTVTIILELVDFGIRINVKDTGIGISRDKQHLVFERFEKLDSFAQGTGLGLAICKAIMETINGKIGFSSTAGEGSSFWAWFPCKEEIEVNNSIKFLKPHESENYSNIPAHSLLYKKYNILIADDTDNSFILIRSFLKQHNLYRVKTSSEAIEMANKGNFDYILIDLRCSKRNDFETIRNIRKFNSKVPIYLISTNVYDSDKNAASVAGCDGFISKPIKRVEIENIFPEELIKS